MPKIRTTVMIDAELLSAVRLRAARMGRDESELIEEAIRTSLGFALLERLWERNDLSADQAMDLGLDAQRAVRQSDT